MRKLNLLTLFIVLIGLQTMVGQKIPGKFAPVNGDTMLIIGQDLGSIEGYVNSGKFPTPAGVTLYTDLFELYGLNERVSTTAGDTGMQPAMDQFSDSALAIGLWMTESGTNAKGNQHPNGLTDLLTGTFNAQLDQLVDFFKRNAPRPIYLRIGYEFDGPWNNYDPTKYKNAYKYIVDYMRARNVDNVAYVWQSATWGATPANIIDDYYPGKEYVDYVGLSFFFYAEGYNDNNFDYILQFARDEQLPIMMAEVSAQYYDTAEGNFHPFDDLANPVNLGGEGIWNQYFKDQLLPFIEQNDDIIRIISYINADWQSQPHWEWPTAGAGFWGDTRIEADPFITQKWNEYINNGSFFHGGPNLLSGLGIENGGGITPTCTDGIQNGDETGIDCGGSCAPCTIGVDPAITRIEAESGSVQGVAQIYDDTVASSGKGVAYLDEVGNGFTIANAPKADKVELLYASQNSGTISIKVNGNDVGDLRFSSNGAWVGNYAVASIDVSVPQGASFQVINDSGDQALNVDYLNFISNVDGQACTGNDVPTASVSVTDETVQGANDGTISLSFEDVSGRSVIEFSIDGGASYPYRVQDNSGTTSIGGLAPGSYDVWTRWENEECARAIEFITIGEGNIDTVPDGCMGGTPDGGTVALTTGETSITACVGNIVLDMKFTTSATSLEYGYVITDATNKIVDWKNSAEGSTIDLSAAAVGECRIWGWSYTGLSAPIAGELITTLDNEECESISSNWVTVTRNDCNDTPNPDITGSFLEPSTGEKMLFIGQDLLSVAEYVSDCSDCPTPTGVATYVAMADILADGFYGALGWTENDQPYGNDVDWGGGPLNAHSAAIGYPNSAVQIGLYLVGQTDNIAAGNLDAQIQQMGDFFKSLQDTAFYLRIGYEFDGNWNGYTGPSYIKAYRRIVDILRAEGVTNVAYVWQSCTSPIDDIVEGGRENLLDFYPGKEYVDWFGMSWFLPLNETATNGKNTPSTQLFLANELIELARVEGKAVMIAESANQGYDNLRLTNSHIDSVWDGPSATGTVNKTGTQIWNEWFAPYFKFINENDDVIKAVTYINANWDVQGLWDVPYEQGYWGDTRIQVNSVLENNWVNEITQSGWIHGSSNLNTIIGLNTQRDSGIITDKRETKINIFPNPSKGVFKIQGKNMVRVVVSDINGRVVNTVMNSEDATEIVMNLSVIEQGIYFVSVLYSDSTKITKRLVINQ